MDQRVLDSYATPGRFTTLAEGEFSSDDVGKVVEVVQGLLLHDFGAQALYGVELAGEQATTIHERDTARLLDTVRAVDRRPVGTSGARAGNPASSRPTPSSAASTRWRS